MDQAAIGIDNLPSSSEESGGFYDAAVRTKESIAPSICTTVHAIDPQSAQYSCEVTVTNVVDEDFSVVEVGYRLPHGVRVNEAIDSAEVELSKKHEQVCAAASATLTTELLTKDHDLAVYNAKQLRHELWQVFKPKNLFEAYFYLIIRRTPRWLKAWRERNFKIDITCANDAERALKSMALSEDLPAKIVVESYIDRLKGIEKNTDYKPNASRAVILKQGQQYKAVYVVAARRGPLSPKSYSLSFDISMRRGDYSISRVEYATLTVPAGNVWTTVVAAISAVIGATTQYFSKQPNVNSSQPVSWQAAWTYVSSVEILVPVLTAIIVYTIFDMTSLKEKFTFSRNWRTAVFVGFACGFLTERILRALGAILGG